MVIITVRFYSSVAPPTTLTTSAGPGDATIQVGSTLGFPALTPYTLSLSYDTISEELVQVNNVGGTTLSVTRGIDGTSATSHGAGAQVRHVTSARDFSDSRNHENADDGIHGLDPGDVLVGEDKAQTLANKTLDMATGTLNSIDIFNGSNWITTVNGNALTPVIVFQIKPDPSSAAVFDFGPTGISRWRNIAAHDTTNEYKFRITKSDGTTDVTYLTSFGQIKSIMSNGVDAWSVQGSPDNVRRRAFATIDLNGSTVRNALYTDGTAFFASKSPAQITAEIRGAAAQSASILKVTSSAGTSFLEVDGSGNTNVGNSLAVNGSVSSPSYLVPGTAGLRPAQRGAEIVSFTSQTSFTVPVVFPTPFTTVPTVTTNINSGDGSTSRWGSRAIGVSASGFTLFVFRGDGSDPASTWSGISVQWMAMQ